MCYRYATSEQGKVGVALNFFGEVFGKVGVARIFSDFTTLVITTPRVFDYY